MKRSQMKYLQQLQAKMNAFILELTAVTKMLEICSNPNCDKGCSLGETQLCDNPNCPNGCSLGEKASNNSAQETMDSQSQETAFGGTDDGDGQDDDEKAKCKCGCGGHHHKHHHHHHHEHNHCSCGCQDYEDEKGDKEECDCDEDCKCGCKEGIDYLNLAKQIQADFDNYRKRNNEAIKVARIEGTKNAVSDFLPILDTISKAINLVHDEEAKHGLELIKSSFETALDKLGVVAIEALGKHYDPNFHNVVISEESDQESGTIIEEIEKGYTYQGIVLKHSIVKIAK